MRPDDKPHSVRKQDELRVASGTKDVISTQRRSSLLAMDLNCVFQFFSFLQTDQSEII